MTAADSKTDKRTIVVDAPAVLTVLLDEEKPAKIKQALTDYAQQRLDLLAPSLLKFEVGNALRSAVSRRRVSQPCARDLYQKFLKLPIKYVQTLNLAEVLNVALKHKLSFYDASYLFLAQNLDLELLTLDKKLNSSWFFPHFTS